jgi:hypothetical protein
VLCFVFELLNFAREICSYSFSFSDKLGQSFQIVHLPGQFRIQLDILIEAASCLKCFLRLFLVIPEFRLGYFFLELENLCAFAFRIKDNLESAVSFPRSR